MKTIILLALLSITTSLLTGCVVTPARTSTVYTTQSYPTHYYRSRPTTRVYVQETRPVYRTKTVYKKSGHPHQYNKGGHGPKRNHSHR